MTPTTLHWGPLLIVGLGHFCSASAQKMDIDAIAARAKVKLIIPDSSFSAVDFLDYVHGDTTMMEAFRNIQRTDHRFSGHLGVSKWKRHNPANSIDWSGHWSVRNGVPVVVIDSIDTHGRLRKRHRKQLYFIENWVLTRFSGYSWISQDSSENDVADGLYRSRRSERTLAVIDQCINGLWPTASIGTDRRYLDFFDSTVVAMYTYVITDESYDGNWAIPYCLEILLDRNARKGRGQAAPCTYCFDVSQRRAMKAHAYYFDDRVRVNYWIETSLHGDTVLGDRVVVYGSIPVSFWRREHFWFTLGFSR